MASRRVAVLEPDTDAAWLLRAIFVEWLGWPVRFARSRAELDAWREWADVLLVDDADQLGADPAMPVVELRKPFSVPELIASLRRAASVVDLDSVRVIDLRDDSSTGDRPNGVSRANE